MTALQAVAATQAHPWGVLNESLAFPLETLLPITVASAEAPDAWMKDAEKPLLTMLESLQPDAVAIPGWGYQPARTALSWCRRRNKVAILMSDSKQDDAPRVWPKEKIKSLLYVKKFDAALVAGNIHRDYLIELGMPRDNIFLGYDVVDNFYFEQQANDARLHPAAARARQPGIPARHYFLAATRFIERKNAEPLIEAYAAYRSRLGVDESWDLVLCGSGVRESAIRQQISRFALGDSVHLPGFIPYGNIGDWYGLASAFVHPAIQEQWGLVINEACAAGLPILCSNTVGACYDLVQDGVNGFTFDPNNPDAMASALLRMHQLNQDERVEMGAASRKIVAEFAPERFAASLMSAIDLAIANK